MGLLRKLLFPFSLLYAGVTSVRNKMYEVGILHSQQYDFPVICVGNLSVGGTGKSPMIEALIALLKDNYHIATLSRGYKRSTEGFLLLEGTETAKEVGDEPLQFKRKFPQVMVAVDENRRRGIEKLRTREPKPEVILLDDAFQHRAVQAGMNILLTSYGNLYSQDLLLPAGNLRESRSGAGRAAVVVVTKCPAALGEDEKIKMKHQLRLLPEQDLFFSGIAYADLAQSEASSRKLNKFSEGDFTLVTGIANPTPLVDFLHSQGLSFRHRRFPDHHNFTPSEIENLREEPLILTTEKDYMRLKEQLPKERLFYLPIKVQFLGRGEAERFQRSVTDFVNSADR